MWYAFRADARAIRYSCVDTSQPPPPPRHILKRTQDGIELLTSGLTLITVWSIVHLEEMKGPTGAYYPGLLAQGRGGTPYDGLCREAPYRKGYLFQASSIRKGRKNCHLLL